MASETSPDPSGSSSIGATRFTRLHTAHSAHKLIEPKSNQHLDHVLDHETGERLVAARVRQPTQIVTRDHPYMPGTTQRAQPGDVVLSRPATPHLMTVVAADRIGADQRYEALPASADQSRESFAKTLRARHRVGPGASNDPIGDTVNKWHRENLDPMLRAHALDVVSLDPQGPHAGLRWMDVALEHEMASDPRPGPIHVQDLANAAGIGSRTGFLGRPDKARRLFMATAAERTVPESVFPVSRQTEMALMEPASKKEPAPTLERAPEPTREPAPVVPVVPKSRTRGIQLSEPAAQRGLGGLRLDRGPDRGPSRTVPAERRPVDPQVGPEL